MHVITDINGAAYLQYLVPENKYDLAVDQTPLYVSAASTVLRRGKEGKTSGMS